MHILQNLLKIIDSAKRQQISLPLEETLTLFKAINTISVENRLIEKVISLILETQKKHYKIKTLSQRENEIFHWIGLGYSSREIGNVLGITESTVGTHRKNIIKKLGLSGSGKLKELALRFTEKSIS